jgi:hypothetical protein
MKYAHINMTASAGLPSRPWLVDFAQFSITYKEEKMENMEKTKKQSMIARFPRATTKQLAFCLAALFCVGLAAQANKPPLTVPQKAQGTQSTQANKSTGASKSLGAWRYLSGFDPMTDDKLIYYTLSSQTGNASLMMNLNCNTREFVIGIKTTFPVWGDYSDPFILCKLRYDKEVPIEMLFAGSRGGNCFAFFRNKIENLKRLSTCKILTIQVPTAQSFDFVTFTLEGIANCIVKMEEESGLKKDSWKL